MSSQDYLYARRMALEKFMAVFEKEYKTIKVTQLSHPLCNNETRK